MLWRQCWVMILSAMLCGGASAREHILVGAFEYPPIYQQKTDKGLALDIMVAAFKAADVDADVKFFPVLRMIDMVSSGQIKCGVGGRGLFADPEIAPQVSVSPPMLNVVQTFLYDSRRYPQGVPYTDLSELAQYRVGVLRGSGIMKFLSAAPGLKLDANSSHEGSAKQLQFARIDLWAVVDLTGAMAYYKTTKAFNLGDISLMCSKKLDPNGVFDKKFREGLARIKNDGSYMQIMIKYYGSKENVNKNAIPPDIR